MLKRYPQLAFNAMSVPSAYMRELQNRYRELATQRVERKIARSLLRLARQTGTTVFTVSHILSRCEQQGLIKTGRQRHGLTTIAEDLVPFPLQDDSCPLTAKKGHSHVTSCRVCAGAKTNIDDCYRMGGVERSPDQTLCRWTA